MSDALFVGCLLIGGTGAYIILNFFCKRAGRWASDANQKHLEHRKQRFATLRERQLEAWANDHEIK